MSKYASPQFHVGLLHPRYWLVWFGMGLMYLISWLPYAVLLRLGRATGHLMMRIMHKRLYVAKRNLELCFPELSEHEIDNLVRENVENSGLALFETCIAWFWPQWRLNRLVEVRGMEKVAEITQQGRGVIILAYHNLNLEICARAMGSQVPGWGVYRPNNNPAYDYVQFKGRVRVNRGMIHKRDVKGMIKALKDGGALWYMPDHDYGPRRSVFVPYFGVEDACTTTGTSILADTSKAAVVGFSFRRRKDNRGYICEVAPVEDFPYHDVEAAATKINQVIEAAIRKAPAEYMWLHRRFKTRPEGAPNLYGDKDPRANR
ncbi:LpxL/LpxP family Kdo(2)-lipid IV(A) lauroyl/palmitoleoyl acyltransferase [Thaumasiovibrio subtropicus]|uniref:LpxL/LpxP family Kdo(2)-lipid IV(A) lauroyl/palmitoleoyl acyltransferase n=1 Tax=Thaumasiovibrio subtropicus TaxID=1891207 RepID=UPI000B35B3B9|nr:LpxL/LpxP family Kdo(2)-lipid IV(A) lauroyl/palmitoleoyl acyltransferase [Thaumasiovibrio subtropicus]